MGIKSKLKNFNECRINSSIYKEYYESEIDDKIIYFESRNGSDFTGNIFRIVEELSTGKYGDFKIYVYAHNSTKQKILKLQNNYNLKIHKIITESAQANQILHKAKYIFTDSGIQDKYIKKEGQVFFSTWHGTPLKRMGFDNPNEKLSIGIIQRSLLFSDYLLYPNDYMAHKMLKAYMIEKIYPGKILFEGYPRNSVFFDGDRRAFIKHKLGLDSKKVFVYMPTFKGLVNDRKDDKQRIDVFNFLFEIDQNLNDNQVLFAKFHPYNQSEINFSIFNHVKPFPEDYEIYDVLNVADCLITDYSSVFFDFANSRRKIIIFNYDEEEYLQDRGLYFPLSDLPFPKVQNVQDLIQEMKSPKNYDDTAFIREFCKYDNPDAVEHICQTVFKGEHPSLSKVIKNTNKNILIYGGSLLNNGITSSLINLLDNVDKRRYNFFISFRPWDDFIKENYLEVLDRIPKGVEFLPLSYNTAPTISEKMDSNKYFTQTENSELPVSLKRLYQRSFKRQYGSIDFDLVVDFDGYNHIESLMFAYSGLNNAIWVHNDMVQEIKTRNKQNPLVLKELYNEFDNVCVVSPDLIRPTLELGADKNRIRLIHNIDNYKKTIQDSMHDVQLEEDTIVYPNDDRLAEVLNSDSVKFINIGRFSPEKGHERLLKAYDEFADQYPNTNLIIIGGHGDLYESTVELAGSLRNSDKVIIIKSILNPMPIVRACDLFVVSSFYEGWPIVIMEADALNLPIIATDITGTQWMKRYGGNIVENSQEGILKGMHEFIDGDISTLNIDYDEYNLNAVLEFYSLFDQF